MQEIQLAYGRGSVSFTLDENRFAVLTSPVGPEQPLTDVEIGEALNAPIESPPLEELLTAGGSVLIVVSDATRASASAQIVNLLVRRIIQIGISPPDITIIFATGIHRAVSQEEKRELLTPFIVQRIKTLDHDAFDPGQLVVIEENSRGTRIELNQALRDFTHIILTGAIGFHYFAGFTGGRKSICPGLAAAQTIESTHMLALDFENGGRRLGVGTGLLEGNAVHEECERIADLVKPTFGINSVVDEHGRAVRVYAGHWRNAHRVACREYLANHSVRIKKQREVVVVSCGGWPYDINLIQAHKALEMASYACKEGGTIILLAECGDGLGKPNFLKWFEEKDSRGLETRLAEAYEVNGQTAWSLLTKAERFQIHLISGLPDEEIRRMRMIPARTLPDLLGRIDSMAEGYVMPRGAAFLPRLESD